MFLVLKFLVESVDFYREKSRQIWVPSKFKLFSKWPIYFKAHRLNLTRRKNLLDIPCGPSIVALLLG